MLRSTKINLYIRVMEKMGVNAKQLLAGTNIDSASLSDPTYTISQTMYQAAIINMLKLSNYSGVPFLVGREIEFADLGIAGYAVMTSATLGQGLDIRQHYSTAFFGTQIDIESVKDLDPGYELVISSSSPTAQLRQFEIEEYFATGLKLIGSLIRENISIESVSFTHPKPIHYSEYENLFDCPIEFNAEKTRMRLRHPSLDTPIITKNEEVFDICTKHCQRIMLTSGDANHVRDRLCSIFLANPRELPELVSAAASLEMSPRTLRRKLQHENVTYEELKAEFRFDLTKQLISDAKMKPKQVAFFLGYSSPSSFGRAFKAWTGETIKSYFSEQG